MKRLKKLSIIIALTFMLFIPIGLKTDHTESNSINLRISANIASAQKSTITKILSKDTSLPADKNGEWVHKLYNLAKSIVNIVLVVILVIIAFASVLNINIETYSIKKMLPRIIGVAVLANLALPLFTVASMLVDTLQTLSIFRERVVVDFGWMLKGIDMGQLLYSGGVTAFIGMLLTGSLSILGSIIGLLVVIFSFLLPLALYLLLSFRPYILFLAIAISPLAFACFILPQTQNLYKKWLNITLAWLVWPLGAYAIINIAELIPAPKLIGESTNPLTITFWTGMLLPAVIRGALLLLAIRFPFMIEKDVSTLLAKLGKTTGSGLVTAGTALGDTAYKFNKFGGFAAQQRAKAEALTNVTGFSDLNDNAKLAMVASIARQRAGKNATREEIHAMEERVALEIGSNGGRLSSDHQKEYVSQQAEQAKNAFEKTFLAKFMRGSGTALSMPLGLYIAFKSNKELMAKEREKSSQKILFASTMKFNPLGNQTKKLDDWINDMPNETTRNLLQYLRRRNSLFATSNARGELGDLKYFEAIATDDLKGRLTPEQILEHMDKLTKQMEKVRERAGKIGVEDPDTQADFVREVFQGYYTGAEGVIAWDRSPLIAGSGMSAAEIAKLKVIWSRFNEERNRELQLQFKGDKTGKEAQLKYDLESIIKGTYNGDIIYGKGGRRLDEGGEPVQPADGDLDNGGGGSAAPQRTIDHTEDILREEENPEHERAIVSSLDSIEKAIRDKSGFDAVVSALTTANLNGTDAVSQGINRRNSQSLRQISEGLKRSGFSDQQISETIAELGQSTLSNMDEVITRRLPRNADQGLQQAFQQFRDTKVHQELSGYMTESGASTERIAQKVATEIPVEIRPQIKTACDQVVKYQLKLDPQISEADYKQASSIIAQHVPSIGTQTASGQGYYVSASTAAHLARGVEATTGGA